jgi:hypothetical protein
VGTAVGTTVGTGVGTAVGTAVGTTVGTGVGTAVGIAVGTGVALANTVIVAPLTKLITINVPLASASVWTVSPILAMPSPCVLKVIFNNARSLLGAIPVALKPAIIILPAVFTFVTRLRPDAISDTLGVFKRLVGYVTVNPNAPIAEVVLV